MAHAQVTDVTGRSLALLPSPDEQVEPNVPSCMGQAGRSVEDREFGECLSPGPAGAASSECICCSPTFVSLSGHG